MRIVVKIGGAAIEDRAQLDSCAHAVADLIGAGHQVAVVHGGGVLLTRLLTQLGKKSEFINGLRVTDGETRDAAIMVLAGSVNKEVMAALLAKGLRAVGMCGGDGGSFRARKKVTAGGADLGFVGEICSTDATLIEGLWSFGAVPVISSVALGTDREFYNVNADQLAASCAVACGAQALIFLTDVPGVKAADGTVIRWLTLSEVEELEKSSVISGGMLPKLEACELALRRGVNRVRILPAIHADMLPEFNTRTVDFGTEVMAQ